MTQTTAMQTTKPANGQQSLATAVIGEENSLAKLNMRELRELAGIMVESGAFPDIKSVAQAMIKVIAGAEVGFTPLVAMTGIHFFQGKVEFSSTLKASLIKGSQKYDFKVTDHTDQRCEIAFFQKRGDEWISCGVPIVYTIKDAQTAGLVGKDNWKKYPKDMLFAACIRQGQRRYCADVLRGLGSDENGEFPDAVDATAIEAAKTEGENATIDVKAIETLPTGDKVDTATGEVVEEAVSIEDAEEAAERAAIEQQEPEIDRTESQLADLRAAAAGAFNAAKGESKKQVNTWLGDRTLGDLSIDDLKEFVAEFGQG